MPTPDRKAAEEAVRQAQKDLTAAQLRLYETHGPGWGRRLGAAVAGLVQGVGCALCIGLAFQSTPRYLGPSPIFLLVAPLIPGSWLLLRLMPATQRFYQGLDIPYGLGFPIGLLLYLFFMVV